jgi:hypothetical protein
MATMPMSMLMRMVMMGGMGGTSAAKAVGNSAGALGSALQGGLAPGTGALGPGLTSLGGSGSAVTAGMGRATSIGALSVPSGWAGAPVAVTATATALPGTDASAAPAAAATGQTGVPPMMPIANMAGRGVVGGAVPKFELRPSVIPRSPAGG